MMTVADIELGGASDSQPLLARSAATAALCVGDHFFSGQPSSLPTC
jgi:hypothetical protein